MLGGDFNAHVLCGSFDLAHSGFDRGAVEIGELAFSDVANLGFRDLSDLVGVRLRRALLDLCGLLDHFGDRGRLEDEGVGTIFEEGDDDRHHFAEAILGGGVHLLTEFSNVHAVLTEGRTERRSWVCLATNDLDLDEGLDFLCHI